MAIRIIKKFGHGENIDFVTTLHVIERNRDRVRTTGNMLLTVSGIIMSATVGVTLFMLKQDLMLLERMLVLTMFPLATVCGASSIYFGVAASLLRAPFAVTTELEMLSAMMRLFDAELRKVTLAFRLLTLSLAAIVVGMLALVALSMMF